MAIFLRPFRKDELTECVTVSARFVGDEILGREGALAAWRVLSQAPGFVAAAAEADPPIGGARIVAFGAGVFVTREFADREIVLPQPYMNARILEAVSRGDRILADEAALARGNAGDGLDFVNLYGSGREDLLSPQQWADAGERMYEWLLKLVAGYRIRRFLAEAPSPFEQRSLDGTGIMRLVKRFEQCGKAVYVAAKEDVLRVRGHFIGALFQYAEPRLRLSRADQRLLTAALDGATDEELAKAMKLSVASVKKGWVRVFQQVLASKPELLSGASPAKASTRGRQKRHLLLAYVRAHPEELRPYDWGG